MGKRSNTGVKEDEFENKDKSYYQHIGLELSKYIHLFIERVDNKNIVMVEYDKLNQPTFLYHKNNQQFYIKSGLASVFYPLVKLLATDKDISFR